METGKRRKELSDPFSIFIKALNAVGCGLTMFLMVCIMADVIGRTLFNNPITGVPELVVGIITIIAFTQLTYVQLVDGHLNVNMFYDKFKSKTQAGIKLFSTIFGVAVFGFMSYSAYGNLLYSIAQKETEGEGALILPMWPVRATIFICCVIMIVIMIRQVYWLFTGRNTVGVPSGQQNENEVTIC